MTTWVVNSYSYPNPFQTARAARGSWEMFESFVEDPSYDSVKAHWEHHASRPVQPHSVESWKATFEELGLLYVPRGTDNVVITPGGHQLLAAAQSNDESEFAWVGLNLILRYPLRGKTGRPSRGEAFEQSDLLLYWFLHAALIELDGFWQQELFRILAHVFRRSEAPAAIDRVRHLRGNPTDMSQHPDPSAGGTGLVYNALNQVLVHGSLNHMLFTSTKENSLYFAGTRENWWYLHDAYRDLISLALGAQDQGSCVSHASLMERLPAAPDFTDEQDYFEHVGATVITLAEAEAQTAVTPTADYGGELVFLLTNGVHFTRIDASHIVGPVRVLCVLAEERRVLVSDDLDYTYMVEHKQLANNEVVVQLRRARPITNSEYVAALFRRNSND